MYFSTYIKILKDVNDQFAVFYEKVEYLFFIILWTDLIKWKQKRLLNICNQEWTIQRKLVTSGKQDEDKQSKNTTQKAEHMRKKDHTKNRRWTQTPSNGKQFLPPIRHASSFSYSTYMFDTTMRKQTNTYNVSTTWTLLQTTGGKDELNIVLSVTYAMSVVFFGYSGFLHQ